MTNPQLTVDSEFESLLPVPNEQELAVLRESILREGCREPITVWKTEDDRRIIVDGHNRYKICLDLKIVPQIQTKKFASRDEAKLWMFEHQVGRRNLTDDQRTAIWASIYIQRAEVSRAKQLEAARVAKTVVDTSSTTEESKPNTSGRTLKAVVKDSGLSERALRTAIKLEKTNPAVAARLRNGTLKLRDAKKTIPKKNLRTKYTERDYFARTGRALATTLLDPRLIELANIQKKDFTPEARQGLQNLILNLKEVKARAQQHIDALNKTLERCR
jgi:ParB-like chromosome segregation protein Spo0J